MLNQEQQQASDFLNGRCCVIACAGSGKTSVLVDRTKSLVLKYNIPPQRIVLISFNRSSTKSLESRIQAELGSKISKKIQINTFHSLGYRVILEYIGSRNKDLGIITEKKIKSIINDLCIGHRLYKSIRDIDTAAIFSYISHQKNNLIEPSSQEESRERIIENNRKYIQNILMDQQHLNEEYLESSEKEKWDFVYRKYEEYKAENNLLDFDDLVFKAVKIMETDKEFRRRISLRCRYIMVDEAQDMNEAQWKFLELLCSENQNVVVVGDPCQNIYGWRGASRKRLINYMKAKDVVTIHLFRNYRSTNQIVSIANKVMLSDFSGEKSFYKPMQSMVGDGLNPIIQIYPTTNHEADDIINFIQLRVNGVKDLNYQDIAVISRTNAQLMVYESKLYNSGIPYQISSHQSAMESKEIKIILNYLILAVDPDNNEAFIEVINTPSRMLGSSFQRKVVETSEKMHCSYYQTLQSLQLNKFHQEGVAEFVECVEKIRNFTEKSEKSPGAIIEFIRRVTKIDAYISRSYGNNSVIVDDVKAMLDSFASLSMYYSSVEELLSAADGMRMKITAENRTGINLCTVHQSKGLEFQVVFVIGVSDGIFPHFLGDIDEERRLFYVALTRAKKELFLSSVNQDLLGNQLSPSRYFEDFVEIPPKI